MNAHYSPHTGEHIDTDTPAHWMLTAPVAPPPYDKAAASAFWRGEGWEVVAAQGEDIAAATLAKARQMRLPVLSILDGLQASALVTAATVPVGAPPVATPLAQVIEDLKQGLRDLPQTVDLSACTTREEMESVVLAAYYTLASSAPAQVKSAFTALVPR